MKNAHNQFKQALRERRVQIGLWAGLADSYVSELLASIGFDWMVLDAEHAPNDVRTVLAQLQAMAPYSSHAIVRCVHADVSLIKQYLDLGVQTLLIPMIETAAEARRMVAATRYPPRGIRGVGSALARASRWNQIDGYLHLADEQICVLVQVESVAGLENLAEIAAVEGVDGVFFGPSDLAASMDILGKPDDPRVRSAIDRGIELVSRAGKAAGILTSDHALARQYITAGAVFVAVGVDTTLLLRAGRQLLEAFKGPGVAVGRGGGY